MTDWRNWKRSPRAGLETCSTGGTREQGNGVRTKPGRKVGEKKKDKN